jgi:hypothetical protein
MARMSYKTALLMLDMNIGNGTIESAAWEVVRARIKEARPTVRAKAPCNKQMVAALSYALKRLFEQEFIDVNIEQLPEVAERLNAYVKQAMQS